jgi:hypothetical protein
LRFAGAKAIDRGKMENRFNSKELRRNLAPVLRIVGARHPEFFAAAK